MQGRFPVILFTMSKNRALPILFKIEYNEYVSPAKTKVTMTPEKELERLLLKLIPTSQFKGIAYSVGGYVRDEILGIESKDLDVVVEKQNGAKQLCELLKSKFSEQVSTPLNLGAAYPIWKVIFRDNIELGGEIYYTKDASIDVADTQKESFPDPATRQRVTSYGTIDDDVRRRDFSCNMLLRDLTENKVIDKANGIKDIKNKVLRHHPEVSPDKMFSDDPLRMIRMVRFCAKYGFVVDPELECAAKRNAERIKLVSGERVRDELVKIMEMGKLGRAIKDLQRTDLLPLILPEVSAMEGVTQDSKYHSEGCVLTHTLLLLEKANPTVVAQLSALLHDVGKPATRSLDGDRIRFLGHEMVSAEMAREIMGRLRFDGDTIAKVVKVVENHLRPHFSADWTAKTTRAFIRDMGESLEDVLHNAEIDQLSSFGPDGCAKENLIPALREKIKAVSTVEVKRKPLVDGKRLMEEFSLNSGTEIGKLKSRGIEIEDELFEQGIPITPEAVLQRLKEERSHSQDCAQGKNCSNPRDELKPTKMRSREHICSYCDPKKPK